MTKRFKTKKTEQDNFLTKNHNGAIKYRIRIQEDEESEQEVKQFFKEQDAAEPEDKPPVSRRIL